MSAPQGPQPQKPRKAQELDEKIDEAVARRAPNELGQQPHQAQDDKAPATRLNPAKEEKR